MDFDVWAVDREDAEVIEGGLRVKSRALPNGRVWTSIWKPGARIKNPYVNEFFPSVAQAEARIERAKMSFMKEIQAKVDQIGKDRLTPEQLAKVSVGDIFSTSWGYDATNVDFYQVVSRTEKTATLRQIRGRMSEEMPSTLTADFVVPSPGEFVEGAELLTRRIQASRDSVYFTFRHHSASPVKRREDGSFAPQYASGAYGGH